MAYKTSETSTLDKPIFQNLDVTSTTAKQEMGFTVTSTSGRKYRYCKTHDGCVATDLAGHPAYYIIGDSVTDVTVTTDFSEATMATATQFAGLTCASGLSASTEVYLWIEVPNGAVTPDASVSTNVAACSSLAAIGTADAYLDVFVNGTSTQIIGLALEADTDNLANIVMFPAGGLSANA